MKVIGWLVTSALVLGMTSSVGAEEARSGTAAGRRDFDVETERIQERTVAADEKVDAAVERAQSKVAHARDALSRASATAGRALSGD